MYTKYERKYVWMGNILVSFINNALTILDELITFQIRYSVRMLNNCVLWLWWFKKSTSMIFRKFVIAIARFVNDRILELFTRSQFWHSGIIVARACLCVCVPVYAIITIWLAVCVRTRARSDWNICHDLIEIDRGIISTNHMADNWSRSNWNISRCIYSQWHTAKSVMIQFSVAPDPWNGVWGSCIHGFSSSG